MSRYTTIRSGKHVMKDRKRVTTEGGRGFTTVDDGQTEVSYVISVSEEGLRYMIERAARNKSKRCVDGPLTVEANKCMKLA